MRYVSTRTEDSMAFSKRWDFMRLLIMFMLVIAQMLGRQAAYLTMLNIAAEPLYFLA